MNMRILILVGLMLFSSSIGSGADHPYDAGRTCDAPLITDLLRVQHSSILIDTLIERPAMWEDGWKVYIKTSPCAGRFDWVTVARQNPTGQGGSDFWQTADLILTGTPMKCVREGSLCTKAAADAEAAVVRAQSAFLRYCCKDYSVWSNPQTGKMKIVVGKFGTGGLGWVFEDGPMCCEEAEARTGIKGACGQGGGTHVEGTTGFGPMTGSSLIGTNLTFYRGTTPEQCQADCAANPLCKGFTLIKAGAYNPNDPPMCYLASAVTGSNNSSCCISGVKGGGRKNAETDEIDLAGTWTAPALPEASRLITTLVLRRESATRWAGTATTNTSPLPATAEIQIEYLGKGKIRYFFGPRMIQYEGTVSLGKMVVDFAQTNQRMTYTKQ